MANKAKRDRGPDLALLRDIEELAALGVAYDRLIGMVQDRHHERAKDAFRRQNGMHRDEPVEEDMVPMPRGASSRTIDRYLKSIRERWAKEEIELRPERRQELRQKLQATFLKAYLEGGPSMGAAVRCLAIQAKIDGLEAPQEINVNQTIDIKSMSPEQRNARLRELYAKRQAAVAAGKVIDLLPEPAKKKPKAKLKRPRKAKK